MKKLGLLVAAGSLWLFLAAVPVFADGGPHVKNDNNGVNTLAADGCAGCHRAHTAQGEMLINAPTEQDLCLTCHGAASTGATTDVMTGIQYAINTTTGLRGAAPLGALRGGGFDQARLATDKTTRLTYIRSRNLDTSEDSISQWPKIPVATTPENVTSAHIAMAQNDLTLPNVAWGNGAAGTGMGAAADVSCADCHNPHGNGQYRILNVTRENATIADTWTVNIRAAYAAAVADPDDNTGSGGTNGPIPDMKADTIYTVSSHGLAVGDAVTIAGTGTALDDDWFVVLVGGNSTGGSTAFKISATKGGAALDIAANATGGTVTRTSGVPVDDAAAPTAGDVRNYTVMQVRSPAQSSSSNGPATDYLLYASQVAQAAIDGDFKGIDGDYSATGGDYFARNVPWNPTINTPSCNPASPVSTSTGGTSTTVQTQCATAPSAPNGKPVTFSGQITQWCASCHTRYFANDNPRDAAAPNGATGAAWQYPRPGDSLFNHQHRTVSGRDCLTCHVSHGSNAAMTGKFSSSFPLPGMGKVDITTITAAGVVTTTANTFTVGTPVLIDGASAGNGEYVITAVTSPTVFTIGNYTGGDATGGTVVSASGSSRLLKVDNRGTCQACHDPTLTTVGGQLLPTLNPNTQVP